MEHNTEMLWERVQAHPGVYDTEDVHHEFKKGGHGRKLDMEYIRPGSDLFDDLVIASTEVIRTNYARIPEVVIGIANGGNPWALALAEELGVKGLETHKDWKNRARMPYASRLAMCQIMPEYVMITDDLGTTGSSTMPLINEIHHNRMKSRQPVRRLSVFYIVQRQVGLSELDKLEIEYDSLIALDLPTFKNEAECLSSPNGFCAKGIKCIPYGQ